MLLKHRQQHVNQNNRPPSNGPEYLVEYVIRLFDPLLLLCQRLHQRLVPLRVLLFDLPPFNTSSELSDSSELVVGVQLLIIGYALRDEIGVVRLWSWRWWWWLQGGGGSIVYCTSVDGMNGVAMGNLQ